jgi:hypothetical protein
LTLRAKRNSTSAAIIFISESRDGFDTYWLTHRSANGFNQTTCFGSNARTTEATIESESQSDDKKPIATTFAIAGFSRLDFFAKMRSGVGYEKTTTASTKSFQR